MRQALDEIAVAVSEGRDAVHADFTFHSEIARATQNPRFADLMGALGMQAIPRARLDPANPADAERLAYLKGRERGAREHLPGDHRPGRGGRPRRHAHPPRQQPRAPAPGCGLG
jgi:DNA-binding GntR family transcriptional regulator